MESSSRVNRIAWIDIAKGIAFIFIVVGHTGLTFSSTAMDGGMPPHVQSFAFTFHLPTFFILSGYFLRDDTRFSWNLIKKPFKSLIVPYILTCLLIILGCTIVGQLQSGSGLTELLRWSEASLWGAGAKRDVALWQVERIGGIWFLLSLFWGQLIIAITRPLCPPKRFALLCCLMAAGVYTNRFFWLPLSIQSGIGCAIYLYIGMLARQFGWLERAALRPQTWVVVIGIWLITIAYGGHASLAMGDYPLGILDVVGGIAGCICICALSRYIDTYIKPLGNYLQLIGRNTLPLFALHIAEDNIINWTALSASFSSLFGGMRYTWMILLGMRLLLDFSLAAIAFVTPLVRNVYFPRKRRRAL